LPRKVSFSINLLDEVGFVFVVTKDYSKDIEGEKKRVAQMAESEEEKKKREAEENEKKKKMN